MNLDYNKDKNLKLKKLLMTLIGVFVTGVSVGMFQVASLGTDPFTSFTMGICNFTGISFGMLYTIICAVMLVIVFLVDKHNIGIATLLNLVGNGFIADATRGYLETLLQNPTFMTQVLLLIFAVVIMCFAASLYFTADLGVSVYDSISRIMASKKFASFKICRITTDLICVIIGFMLKASVGIGTLITALFMGPLIQWFNTNISEPFLYGKNINVVER